MTINYPRQHLIDSLAELTGIKAGIYVDEGKIINIFDNEYELVKENFQPLRHAGEWWRGDREEIVRIRAEELQGSFILLLNKIGALESIKGTNDLATEFLDRHLSELNISRDNIMEWTQVAGELKYVISVHILDGVDIPDKFSDLKGIDKLVDEFRRRYILSKSMPERREWDGIIPLEDLFESEAIPENSNPDSYFDQRYIDYLNSQINDVGKINWRQFEYMTGEYFQRKGYDVEVTKGRGDGGVDVVAEKEDDIMGPLMVTVQCKRYAEGNPVEIDSIKAFWSTVRDEEATKGLVATTSRLTSGAKSYCEAREYRLDTADREKIVNWLEDLSSETT